MASMQFVRPEQLDKAIKLAQADKSVGARTSARSKIPIKEPNFDASKYQFRDRDVETTMSRRRMHKVRVLSEHEVEEIVVQAKMKETRQAVAKEQTMSKITSSRASKLVENLPREKPYEEVFSEYDHGNLSETDLQKDETDYKDVQTSDEKAFFSLTKSVESSLQAVENLLQIREQQKTKARELYESYSMEFRTPYPCYAEIEEKPITDRRLVSEIKKPFLYKNPLGEKVASQLKSVTSYTSVQSSQPKQTESDAETDFKEWMKAKSSEESNHLEITTSEILKDQLSPHFNRRPVNVPKMSLAFLKTPTPMRFTELTEDGDVEQNMKVFIKNKLQIQESYSEPVMEKVNINTVAPKSKVPLKSPRKWQPPVITTTRPKSQRISEPNYGSVAYSARAPSLKSNTSNTARTQSVLSTNSSPKPLSRFLSGRHSVGKTLEVLKSEKLDIFQKMSNTQERIIELLDKLKMSLLEVYIPSCTHEKNKRQKNAMEFSVRFSRNFLYPLKGMIEDVRITSTDALNSANSNDATLRIANIYNLLLQCLSTYHKQLRFFLLDQVPQKLNTVLEMINSVTKCCVHKGFFDTNDTIVECMLDRSNKFLEFLTEFHEKPEKQDTQTARGPNPTKLSNKHYELKMCINDLNMYEPKVIVAKRKSRKTSSKKTVENKPPMETIVVPPTQTLSSSKSEELFKLNLENVATQMMKNQQNHKPPSTCWDSTHMQKVENPKLSRTQKMTKKLSEALRNATKNQVSHVLKPMLQNFGINSLEQVGFLYP